jgi:hypothetical protein
MASLRHVGEFKYDGFSIHPTGGLLHRLFSGMPLSVRNESSSSFLQSERCAKINLIFTTCFGFYHMVVDTIYYKCGNYDGNKNVRIITDMKTKPISLFLPL